MWAGGWPRWSHDPRRAVPLAVGTTESQSSAEGWVSQSHRGGLQCIAPPEYNSSHPPARPIDTVISFFCWGAAAWKFSIQQLTQRKNAISCTFLYGRNPDAFPYQWSHARVFSLSISTDRWPRDERRKDAKRQTCEMAVLVGRKAGRIPPVRVLDRFVRDNIPSR